MIQPGDKLPSVSVKLIDAGSVNDVDTLEILGHGRVVLFAVPGAFTPTCDTAHLPGFVANAGKIRAMGVDRIV
jgi:peroxiredoxin